MSEKDLKGKYSGSITGDVTLTNSTPSANGELGYDPAQGFLGYHNGAVGPIGGGDTSMEIVDNDSNADGTVILKAGSRWLNGRVATNASDITTAAPSSGSDDTIRDLDGSTGLRAETSVTIRNYVYWDMINDKYVTISNASDSAKQAYDSTSRTINTTEYAPIGYVDVAESGGAHTLTVENYPNQSWDSYKELQAADGWQDWTPTITASGSMTLSNIYVYFSKYRRVGNSVEFVISAVFDIGGTASNEIRWDLPIAPKIITSSPTNNQYNWLTSVSDTAAARGFTYNNTSSGVPTNQARTRKIDSANFVITTDAKITVQGSYEIDADIGYNVIATPATEFDWRSANLVQKTTGADITSSDPIGTFVAWKYDASNNESVDTTTLSQSISDIKANGFRIYARARDAASTPGLPPQIHVKVAEAGAGIGSFHVDAYGATGFSNTLMYNRMNAGTSNGVSIGAGVMFSKSPGVIVIDAGSRYSNETSSAFVGTNYAAQNFSSGYFTVKASATTPLVGLPKTVYYENDKLVAAAGTDWAGTVSQNGTSSVIERGSNVNGQYVKFADGTMICTKQTSVTTAVSTPTGSMFWSGSGINPGTTAATFVTIEGRNFNIDSTTDTAAIVAYSTGASINNFGNFYHLSDVSRSSRDYTYFFTVSGRWY